MTAAIQPRCGATTGRRVTDYGFEPLQCHQRRALRFVEARDGSRLAYCAAPGHREQVTAKAGRKA